MLGLEVYLVGWYFTTEMEIRTMVMAVVICGQWRPGTKLAWKSLHEVVGISQLLSFQFVNYSGRNGDICQAVFLVIYNVKQTEIYDYTPP